MMDNAYPLKSMCQENWKHLLILMLVFYSKLTLKHIFIIFLSKKPTTFFRLEIQKSQEKNLNKVQQI
jgi:hypothetical protein